MKRIKKCLIFLFLIMIFIPFTKVDAKATCADVKAAVNQLNTIDKDLEQLKCEAALTDKVIGECNRLHVAKTSVLEEIFEYHSDKVCPSVKLGTIISNYKDSCSNGFSSNVKEFADSVMKIFYIIAPFILILFGSLDFFKIMAGANPDEAKKHRQNFIKRVIAFFLLYLTPFFVRTIFSITPYDIDASDFVCSQEITFTPKITSEAVEGYYFEDGDGVGGGSCGAKIVNAAKKNAAFAKQQNFRWCDGSECPLSCSVKTCYTKKNSLNSTCCATLVTTSVYQAGLIKASDVSMMHSAGGTSENLNKHGFKFIKYTNKKMLKPGDILVYACKNSGCHITRLGGTTVRIGHVAIYAGNGKQYDHGTTKSIRSGGYKNFWSDSDGKYLYGVLRCKGN